VRSLKQIGLESMHLSLRDAFCARYEAEEIRLKSDDCKEGPLAFIEKRAPNWVGR
jgi:crotonobetainyl-CoA hydratase/dehydration protein DpgD